MVEALASQFTVALRAIIHKEMDMQLKVQEDAMELQETLRLLRSKLHGVRKEKVLDLDVRKWIDRLEDVMFDAEDVVDECHLRDSELRRLSTPPSPQAVAAAGQKFPDFPLILTLVTLPYRFFFKKLSYNRDMSLKLQALNLRLQMLKNQRDKFDLRVLDSFQSSSAVADDYCHGRNTFYAAASSPNVVGTTIRDDADFLLRLLTDEHRRTDIGSGDLLVFAIVGPGGIGKTTMANLILESLCDKKKGFFDLIIRVAVSRNFDKLEVMKQIIMASGTGRCDEGVLGEAAKEAVKGKKLFLLLDDVWDAMGLWNLWIGILFRGICAPGSRVLITTRNRDAADQMNALYCHSVQPLTGEEGWELLCRCVGSSPEAEQMKILKNAGLQIVEKCYGNPLAIMSMGGMLCLENKARVAWERLLADDVWHNGISSFPDGIHKDIYGEFDGLPSAELQRCFIYCSLFPDGREITCSDIIEIWVAEGIVDDDETALSCFRHLLRKNVLVPRLSSEFALTCKMDGLSCSLGRFIMKGEGLVVTQPLPVPLLPQIPEMDCSNKLRRLSLVIEEGGSVDQAKSREYESKMHDFLKNQGSLRTLLLFNHPLPRAGKVLCNLPCIRVLGLRRAGIGDEQLESIESLVHLRFLDISENEDITKLPESLGKLAYLQVLRLQSCRKLSQLPNSFLQLNNLTYLDARQTEIEGFPEGLGTAMPKLRKIMPLHPHEAGKKLATMEDLKEMKKLRSLELEVSANALTGLLKRAEEVANAGVLECKRWLRELVLKWPPEEAAGKNEKDQRSLLFEVSDKLSPPEDLEDLRIFHYYGSKLPSWSPLASRLPNLRTLHLEGCLNLKEIPALGQLPCLEHLLLKQAPKVTIIGKQFLKKTLRGEEEESPALPFPKLTVLRFEEMEGWEKWEWPAMANGTAEFPFLRTLSIQNCPKLKSMPEGLLSRSKMLRRLDIAGAPELRLERLEYLPSSVEIIIRE